mgnify:FL=1
MEKVLNTISKSKANNFSGNTADFKLEINFERNSEQVGNEVLKLNKISVDEVELLSEQKRKNGVLGIEGELLVNHNKNVNFELDLDGSLHISDFNCEKYSINEMGELILEL